MTADISARKALFVSVIDDDPIRRPHAAPTANGSTAARG